MQGEFKKIKAPYFARELDLGDKVEEWILGMSKYFEVHDYSIKTKARFAIYSLNGKYTRRWQDFKPTKH